MPREGSFRSMSASTRAIAACRHRCRSARIVCWTISCGSVTWAHRNSWMQPDVPACREGSNPTHRICQTMLPTFARLPSRLTLIVSLCAFLGACSTATKDISAVYVSPTQYQSYDCQQLSAETQRLQGRYMELGGRLDQAASNDKTLTGVGLILFWPALFALGGTKQQEAEYARLRGEHDAVQQASVQKRCGQAGTASQTPVTTAAPTAAN